MRLFVTFAVIFAILANVAVAGSCADLSSDVGTQFPHCQELEFGSYAMAWRVGY
jgi:tetrahydromethanopterin S-methyltransferase subunit E